MVTVVCLPIGVVRIVVPPVDGGVAALNNVVNVLPGANVASVYESLSVWVTRDGRTFHVELRSRKIVDV
jgi:hypothetical protein